MQKITMQGKRFLFILALLSAIVQGVWAQNYDVWDGVTTDSPILTSQYVNGKVINERYLIQNAANLAFIRENWKDEYWSFYKKRIDLEADIDMGDVSWIPLGSDDDGFEGMFKGNGHTIKIKIDINFCDKMVI